MGVAFVSRVAKNFQDYYINVITQRLGARIYQDGIRHVLDLPYQLFEDQRSGETLGRLQKVRTDVEKLINIAVNLVFVSLVGVVFVMIYAYRVHWVIAVVYFSTVPLLSILSWGLSKKIKTVQKTIVAETTALAGATTESLRNIELVKSLGLAQQEMGRLNRTTDKILGLELKKVRYLRSLSFIQGTAVNALRTSILFLMLYLIFQREISVGQFFSLWIYSFFIFGPLQVAGDGDQHVPRDRGLAEDLRRHPGHTAGAAAGQPRGGGGAARAPFRCRELHAPDRPRGRAGRRLLRRRARGDDRVRGAVGHPARRRS